MQAEIDSLQRMVKDREDEIQTWRSKYEQAAKRATMIDESERRISQIQEEKEELENILNEKDRVIYEVEAAIREQAKSEEIFIDMIMQKVLQSAEIDRLNGLLGEANRTIDELRNRVDMLSATE
jgi:predicted RNase H-like nuclease (RuvC/YqgF family)